MDGEAVIQQFLPDAQIEEMSRQQSKMSSVLGIRFPGMEGEQQKYKIDSNILTKVKYSNQKWKFKKPLTISQN